MNIFSIEKAKELKAKETHEKKHTILLVDDEIGNLEVMASVLQDSYNLLKASDGQKAMDLILAMDNPEKISLILTDQRMPNMTGSIY